MSSADRDIFSGVELPQCSRKKYTVAVEGNIGSGKTTVLKYFAADPKVQVIPEPTDLWRNMRGHNTLDLMYKDAKRWSLAFQSYVQLTMLEVHCARKNDVVVKLMERSLFSARYCFVENLHQRGQLPGVDYAVLQEWFQWIVENVDIGLDLIVYLRTSPTTCQQRMKRRDRSEEAAVPLDYLNSLHELHEDWLIRNSPYVPTCPVLVLDASCGLDEMYKCLEQHRHLIVPSNASDTNSHA